MMALAPVVRLVVDLLEPARSGRFAEIRGRFAPNLRPLVLPDTPRRHLTEPVNPENANDDD